MSSALLLSTRHLLFGLLAAAGLLLLAGCGEAVYGTAGYGYYGYDYYPGADVYFYPDDDLYYWNDGRDWRWGHRLPDGYHLHDEDREHLQLHSRQPWTEHAPEHREFQGHYQGHYRSDRR